MKQVRASLFLRHKLERQIKTNGSTFVFTKSGQDKYKQPVKTDIEVEIQGVYLEEGNIYIETQNSENARVNKVYQPMIMCMHEDGVKLSKDDVMTYNGSTYRINGKRDINNFGVGYILSLEVIGNGFQN